LELSRWATKGSMSVGTSISEGVGTNGPKPQKDVQAVPAGQDFHGEEEDNKAFVLPLQGVPTVLTSIAQGTPESKKWEA